MLTVPSTLAESKDVPGANEETNVSNIYIIETEACELGSGACLKTVVKAPCHWFVRQWRHETNLRGVKRCSYTRAAEARGGGFLTQG